MDLPAQIRSVRGEIDDAVRRVIDSCRFITGAGEPLSLAMYPEIADADIDRICRSPLRAVP